MNQKPIHARSCALLSFERRTPSPIRVRRILSFLMAFLRRCLRSSP
jgi:hypothetical protein